MTEEDIKMQLEGKNKEIYHNKLQLDLNNNMEVLVLTIDNLLNKITMDSVSRIIGIAETFRQKESVEKEFKEFRNSYQEFLMKLLEEKKKKIEEKIKGEENHYWECFQEETNHIKEAQKQYLNETIRILSQTIQEYFEEEFCKTRIKDYLETSFQENLINKIETTLKDRDVILLNTFKETYLKYLELNKNTVGIE